MRTIRFKRFVAVVTMVALSLTYSVVESFAGTNIAVSSTDTVQSEAVIQIVEKCNICLLYTSSACDSAQAAISGMDGDVFSLTQVRKLEEFPFFWADLSKNQEELFAIEKSRIL